EVALGGGNGREGGAGRQEEDEESEAEPHATILAPALDKPSYRALTCRNATCRFATGGGTADRTGPADPDEPGRQAASRVRADEGNRVAERRPGAFEYRHAVWSFAPDARRQIDRTVRVRRYIARKTDLSAHCGRPAPTAGGVGTD